MLNILDNTILPALVLLPALGAAFVALVRPPRSRPRWAGQLTRFNALMFSMGTLCLAAIATARLAGGAQLGSAGDWLRVAMGLDVAWGLDAISALGVMVVALITPAAVLASSRQTATPAQGHFAWLLVSEACLLGALLSRDLLLLSFFADGAIVATFLALGRSRRVRGDRSFRWLTIQMLASGAWWVGVLHLGWVHFVKTGLLSFAFADLLFLDLSVPQAVAVGTLLAVATAIRAGVWPLDYGRKRALHNAPVGASVLLVGGVMKLGIYLAVAVVVPATLPHALHAGLGVSIALTASMLVAAISCYRQRTLLDFLSHSAAVISALALLGVTSGTAMGFSGAVLLLGAHAISFAGLMLAAVWALPGATSAHLADLMGLARRRPVLAAIAATWLLSMVAVPGLGVFAGASMVLGAKMPAIRTGNPYWIAVAVAAAFAVAMHTAQMVMLVIRLLLGPRDPRAAREPLPAQADTHRAVRAMGMTMVLLGAMLLIALGADLFEPALAGDASRSLATATRRDTFPPAFWTSGVGPWSRAGGQLLALAGVAAALAAVRSRRTRGVLGWLAAVQLAGAALAALTGDRPPSLSIGYGAGYEAQSMQALCSVLGTQSNYCYLSDGLRVAAVSLVSLGLHALAVVLALGYVARTRRKPIGRLGGLAGLASSHPGSAAAIGVALWSVAGLAPTLGAMGGVMRLGVAISAGWPGVAVGWGAAGALSVVACLRVIVAMLRPAPGDAPVGDVPVEPMAGGIGQLWRVAITAAVAAVVAGGVWPELLMEPLSMLLP